MARAAAGKFYADNYNIPMPVGSQSGAGTLMVRDFKFTCLTTAPGTLIGTGAACVFDTQGFFTGDKLYLCQLGQGDSPGWQLVHILIDIPDVDSGTSFVLQLGDSVAADTFVTTTLAGTLGQSTGRISSFGPVTIFEAEAGGEGMCAGIVRGTLPKSYSPATYATFAVHDDLILTAQTGAGTGLVGASVIIKGQIWYTQGGLNAL